MRRCGVLALAVALAACGGSEAAPLARVYNGDADSGRALIRAYGCGACHRVPGVRGADAHAAPPLDRFARRAWIAGSVPNTPDNLVAWIMNPHAVEPGTAMPMLDVPRPAATHMAAYLYTLD
jgi:cytochrome c2